MSEREGYVELDARESLCAAPLNRPQQRASSGVGKILVRGLFRDVRFELGEQLLLAVPVYAQLLARGEPDGVIPAGSL